MNTNKSKYNKKKNNKRYNHGAGCGDEPWYCGSTQDESWYSGRGGVTRRWNLNRVSSIGTACIIHRILVSWIHWILVEKPHNSAGRRGCRCCGEWVIYTSHTIANSDLHWDLGWTSITIWVLGYCLQLLLLLSLRLWSLTMEPRWRTCPPRELGQTLWNKISK